MVKLELKGKFFDFLSMNSKKIFLGLATVISLGLIALGGLWWYAQTSLGVDSEILATVGSERVTKADFKRLSYVILRNGTPESPVYPEDTSIKDEILNVAIEKILVHNEASDLGLAVTDEEALVNLQAKDPNYFDGVLGASDILDYEKYLLEKERITTQVGGNKSGSIITAREDVYYPEDGNITTEIAAKIATNYTYAETFINDIYSKLVDGTITAAQAIQTENTDTTIGEDANPLVQTFHSGIFTAEGYRLKTGLLSHTEVLAAINSLGAGEISEPIHVTSTENLVGEYKNIGWFVVVLDEDSGASGQTFDQWLASEKEVVGVDIVGDLSSIN